MGWTLAEGQKLGLPGLIIGSLPTIVEASPLLGGVGIKGGRKALTFQTVNSNGLRINRELTLPVSDWYTAGGEDTITSSKSTYTQVTHTLSMIASQRDFPLFITQATRDQQDPMQLGTQEMIKSLMRAVEDRLVYGGFPANTKEPTGLHGLLATDVASSAQVIYASADATADAGILMSLRAGIDLAKLDGGVDLVIMTRRTRRNLSSYGSALTSPMHYRTDEFGKSFYDFDGIPIAISDMLKDTETLTAGGLFSSKTGGSSAAIFGVKIGDRAYTGYQNGPLRHDFVGKHQSQDADIHRMVWYVSANFMNLLAGFAYFGVSDAVWTNV